MTRRRWLEILTVTIVAAILVAIQMPRQSPIVGTWVFRYVGLRGAMILEEDGTGWLLDPDEGVRFTYVYEPRAEWARLTLVGDEGVLLNLATRFDEAGGLELGPTYSGEDPQKFEDAFVTVTARRVPELPKAALETLRRGEEMPIPESFLPEWNP